MAECDWVRAITDAWYTECEWVRVITVARYTECDWVRAITDTLIVAHATMVSESMLTTNREVVLNDQRPVGIHSSIAVCIGVCACVCVCVCVY